MELSVVRELKAKAEQKIMQAVADAMFDFTAKTGLSIEDVHINMQEVTTYSSKSKAYLVASVSCKVDYD